MESTAIRDQRTMCGPHVHETVGDVTSFWRAHASQRGFRRHSGLVARELDHTDLESPVYISAGMWVADCPNRECNGAAACWIANPEACCLDCGTVFKPVWPTEDTIGGTLEEVVAVLAAPHRAKPQWRNFRASHKGETLGDLKAQNLAMGDSIPGGRLAKGPHPLDSQLVRG